MEFNWITFFLEIINFLVLMWILKRLLYQPIKKVILARKEAVQKTLDAATQAKKEATELQAKYEGRSKEWGKEREEKLIQLQHEMQEEKNRQLAALANSLKTEKEKAEAQEEQRTANRLATKEKEVIANSIKFSAQFLKPFADRELENRILELLLDSFLKLPSEKITILKKEINDHNQEVQIQSAFQLTESQKNQITSTIEKIFDHKNLVYNYTLHSELLAGFLVSIGSIVFDMNLKNELRLFTEAQMNG